MATPDPSLGPPPVPEAAKAVIAGGLFASLKPHDVSDEEWTCWMLEYGTTTSGADRREFNLWWVSKVKTDILKRLVRPVEVVKSRRRVGRYRLKPGLSMQDRRPDIERSLQDFGALFFETPFGYHKKLLPDPGRKVSATGNIIIAWYMDSRALREPLICMGQQFPGAVFFNGLAAVYAVVENAEARGDRVSLIVHPRNIERRMQESTDIDYSKHTRDWDTMLFDGDGKPVYAYNPFGMAYTVHVLPEHGVPSQAHVGYLPPMSVSLWVSKLPGADSRFWANATEPDVIRTVPELRQKAEKLAAEIGARTGSSPPRVAVDDPDGTPISDALFYFNSREYEGIKEALLATAPFYDTDWFNIFRPIATAVDVYSRLSHGRRGTFIIIGATEFPGQFHPLKGWLRAIEKQMDVIFIDLAQTDMSEFFTHPLMIGDAGKPLVKYVHVGQNVDQLTERLIRAIGGTIDGVALG